MQKLYKYATDKQPKNASAQQTLMTTIDKHWPLQDKCSTKRMNHLKKKTFCTRGVVLSFWISATTPLISIPAFSMNGYPQNLTEHSTRHTKNPRIEDKKIKKQWTKYKLNYITQPTIEEFCTKQRLDKENPFILILTCWEGTWWAALNQNTFHFRIRFPFIKETFELDIHVCIITHIKFRTIRLQCKTKESITGEIQLSRPLTPFKSAWFQPLYLCAVS